MNFPYKLIDLTHTLHSSIPTWDGDCGFNQNIVKDYSDCKNGVKFRVMRIQMHAGIGTHMDAPSHCISGGRSIHEFDVNEFCMPCVVIDISKKVHESYSLSTEDIVDFESTHGTIAQKTCVMIKTGWEKFWSTPKKYCNDYIFPSVSAEAADLLIKRNISALGVDTLSPDRPTDHFIVHQKFLSQGKIIIENAANLNQMPSSGGYILSLPIKIKDGTEAPIRLIGLIKN